VFFLNIVNELKEHGYSNREAVGLALNRSGAVIEIAGLIMLIAFGGLMMSSVSSMGQMGFFLTLGLLVDATVDTLLITPALMLLLDEYS